MGKYHYKGVTFQRLKNDLKDGKDTGLPNGIRLGSATAKAMGSRQPTKEDQTALWFTKEDEVETAQDYCDKAGGDSVVLRADLDGYTVTEDEKSVHTECPVKWVHIEFEGKDGDWLPIFQYVEKGEVPKNVAMVRADADSDDESEPDDF